MYFRIFMYFCVCLLIINAMLVITSGWVGAPFFVFSYVHVFLCLFFIINARLVVTSGWADALIFVFSYFHVFLCLLVDYQRKVGYYIWVGGCTYPEGHDLSSFYPHGLASLRLKFGKNGIFLIGVLH